MSRNSRRTHRTAANPHKRQWKLIDDHSGFEMMSDQAVIDHRNRITTADNFDPISWTELPVNWPIDQPIPFSRPEPADHLVHRSDNSLVPATYNDHWVPQPSLTNGTYVTTASNPNASFGNYMNPNTFGPLWQNGTGNDIVELPTTGNNISYGDSYKYFRVSANITQGSPQDMLYPAYLSEPSNPG